MQRDQYNRGTARGLQWHQVNEINRSLDRLDYSESFGHRERSLKINHRFVFDAVTIGHQVLSDNRWLYSWASAFVEAGDRKFEVDPDGWNSTAEVDGQPDEFAHAAFNLRECNNTLEYLTNGLSFSELVGLAVEVRPIPDNTPVVMTCRIGNDGEPAFSFEFDNLLLPSCDPESKAKIGGAG